MYVALQLPVWSKSIYLGEKVYPVQFLPEASFGLQVLFFPLLILIFKQWATLHLCSGLHIMNFLTMCHPTLVYVPPLVFDSSE